MSDSSSNSSSSNGEEPGEFGVDWAASVDEKELFDEDDHKLDVVPNMKTRHGEEATHGMTTEEDDDISANHSSSCSSSGNSSSSSVEEQDNYNNNKHIPEEAPYKPSPASNNKGMMVMMSSTTESIEQLEGEKSRLASFGSNLQFRFSQQSEVSGMSITDGNASVLTDYEGHNEDDENNNHNKIAGMDVFPEEEKGEDESDTFQATAWDKHGQDDSDDDDDDDAAAHKEKEGGDAFAVSDKANLGHTNGGDPKQRKSQLSKEHKQLSTTWMNFDDDKWDGSKHSHGGEDGKRGEEESKTAPPQEQAPPPPASTANNKSSAKNSLAGLAKVKTMKKPKGPASEQKGGADAKEVISFWGEGSEEDEEQSANDPLAIALKTNNKPGSSALTLEQHNNDSATMHSALMGSKSSTLDGPHSSRSSSMGAEQLLQQQQQQSDQPGWIQKGLGQAIGMVKSNLPFTKPNDDDDDAEEDNVVEVDDMPFPNYTKGASNQASNKPSAFHVKNNGSMRSMQDVSAMSDDSYFEQQVARLSNATVPLSNTSSRTNSNDDIFDPCNAVVKKMNQQKDQNRISFAEGVKREIPNEKKMANPALPLFDVFLDIPHPAEVKNTAEVMISGPSEEAEEMEIQNDIRESLPDIACLAFPDYDSSTAQENTEEDVSIEVRRYMKHPLESPGFQHHTFRLKLQSGIFVYGHVRRYLPALDEISFRYDAGRRLGRALVIFTRFPGGDDFFAAVLR